MRIDVMTKRVVSHLSCSHLNFSNKSSTQIQSPNQHHPKLNNECKQTGQKTLMHAPFGATLFQGVRSYFFEENSWKDRNISGYVQIAVGAESKVLVPGVKSGCTLVAEKILRSHKIRNLLSQTKKSERRQNGQQKVLLQPKWALLESGWRHQWLLERPVQRPKSCGSRDGFLLLRRLA